MDFAKEQACVIAAVQAKATRPCPIHSEVLTNQYDDEANRRAYAIGTNLWKEGDIPCERTEFMEAIKDAIDNSADECGACTKLMED